MINTGIDFILISCSLQAIITAYILLLKSKKNNLRQNIALSIFIQLGSFVVLKGWYIGSEGYLVKPAYLFLPLTITIGLGPVYYIYVRLLLQKNYRFKKEQYLHLLPSLLQFSYFLWLFLKPEQERISYFQNEYFNTVLLYEEMLNFLCFSVYLTLSFQLYMKYRKSLAENYSEMNSLLFKAVGVGLIGMFCLQINWMVISIADFFFYDYTLSYTAYYFSYFIILIAIYFITYYGLFDTSIVPSDFVFKTKENPKALSRKLVESYLEKINEAMDEKQLFLNYKLTLQEMANEIDINPKYLSQVINTEYNKNFRDFVNGYRIEKAKQELIKAKTDGTYIAEIIYKCGFNSKSTFNDAFKKYTSKTPTLFMKDNCE